MKYVISLFLLTALIVPCNAEKLDRYVFGGFSAYDENEQFSVLNKGVGLRVGGGLKFNGGFGVELIFDNSPATDPARAIELLSSEYDSLAAFYGQYDVHVAVNTERNFYVSGVGTITLPINDRRSWVFKGGIAYSAFETSFKPGNADFAVYNDEDLGFTFSAGMAIQRNENRSILVSLSHTTGEAKSFGAHFLFRHHF